MNGKGSKPRPLSVTRDEFTKRWNETFHKHEPAFIAPSEGFLIGNGAREWLWRNKPT